MALRSEQLVHHIRRLVSASASSPDSDAVLLEHFIQQRDEASFAALVQRHGAMVLGVCRRILGNVHDAEDAFQAAFLVLARKASAVQPREALTAWLYGVARRVALKACTTRTKYTSHRRPLTPPVIATHASPLDDLSSREMLAIFDEEVQRLPRVYRLPLILCCLEGRTQEEAARQLGWTPGSVKGRLERGRARLQTRLTRRGLLLSAALMLVEATRGSVAAALVETATRESLHFLAGKSVAGTATALADMTLRGMTWSRGAVWAGLMSLLLAVAGTATLALQTPASKPPEIEQPPISAPEQRESRKDQRGDPLPPGAVARLGTSRFRGVRGCPTFSSDGKWLATATGRLSDSVTIWDAATGQQIRHFDRVTTLSLYRLVFSPDGKRLACSDSRHCRVLDTTNGKELFTVAGTHGVFAGNGKTLVTADAALNTPADLHVWDARTGRLLRQWAAAKEVTELAISDDGRTVVWMDAADHALVRIRDAEKDAALRSLRVGPSMVYSLALTRDGKTLAVASDFDVRLWDVASGKNLRVWKGQHVSRPAFSADDKQLAWVGGDGMGQPWLWTVECEGDKPRKVGPSIHGAGPACFSPDGKALAVQPYDFLLSLRDVANGKEVVACEAHDSPIVDLAFSADGRHVFSRADNDLFVWQTRSGKLLRRLPFLLAGHESIGSLLPGGFLLSRESTTDLKTRGRFWLRDMRTGEATEHFDGLPEVRISPEIGPAAVITPDHRSIALRGRTGEMCLMDVRKRRCLYRLPENTPGAKLSADGEVLAWYYPLTKGVQIHVRRRSSDKLLILDNLPKGDHWRRIFEEQPCLSPDGRWLVLPTEEGPLRRWDLTTGKETAPLIEALRTAWYFWWSPDSRFVAVHTTMLPSNAIDNSLGDKPSTTLRVWDMATGTRLRHLTLPIRDVMRVLFSSDGCTLVTTDEKGVISLWETATGQQRARFQGHLWGQIGALVLSPDGRMLASGGYDSQGFVWDVTGRMPDGQWHQTRLSPEQRRAAWEALAGADARAAYRAIWQLAADPDGTLALFREQLRPVTRPKPEQVKRWLATLDSTEFAEREQATGELEKVGETVAADLRRALANKPTLEMRRRIEALLAQLDGPPRGRRLQALRALEALEHINTPEARAVLRKLATGAAGARLTEEARRPLGLIDSPNDKSNAP